MKDIKTEAKTASKKLDLFHIDFPVPTPVGGGQTRRLKTLVRKTGVDRGSDEIELSEGGSQSQDDNDRVSNLNKEMLNDKDLFKKLKSNIAARSKLTLIHAARAYNYGHDQFDPKLCFKEFANILEN